MSYNLSTKEYNQLLQKVTLRLKGVDHVDPGDLINDAILEVMEKGELLIPDLLYKTIFGRISKEKFHPTSNGMISRNYSKSESTKVCCCCKEEIPINGFYLVRRKRKDGLVVNALIEEYLSRCKECQKKYVKNRLKRLRAKGIKYPYTEAQKKSHRKYKSKPQVKRKLKEYIKSYMKVPENYEKHKAAVKKNYYKPEVREKKKEQARNRYYQSLLKAEKT